MRCTRATSQFKKNRKSTLTTLIKNNFNDWKKNKNVPFDQYLSKCTNQPNEMKQKEKDKSFSEKKHETSKLATNVHSKISKGDIKNAIRILTSVDTIGPKNEDNLAKLQQKHSKSEVLKFPEPLDR